MTVTGSFEGTADIAALDMVEGVGAFDAADDLATAAVSVARRFAAGATMWCVAPQWPSHSRHVAVEFVHPVIVGKRALPAVSLDGSGMTDDLRLLARPGDLLVAVGSAGDGPTVDLLRRAEAWGLTRMWLGTGARPRAGLAEHVIWLESVDPDRAVRSGEVVLLYHLLWELTHVVFEHPGLLEEPELSCTDEVCVTCSDEALVAEIRVVHRDGRAEALVRGSPQRVDVTLVEPVGPGDLVLVHAGVALTQLEPGTGPGIHEARP